MVNLQKLLYSSLGYHPEATKSKKSKNKYTPKPPRDPAPGLWGLRLVEHPPRPSTAERVEQVEQKRHGERDEAVQKATERSLGAVVVTIHDTDSYDSLFRTVPQLGDDGEIVRVYECLPDFVEHVVQALRDGAVQEQSELNPENEAALRMLCEDIRDLGDPDAVVFNYECCSGCCATHFNILQDLRPPAPARDSEDHRKLSNQRTLEHIAYFIERGFMVMCSDFSLKALIENWDPTKLGPNPFVQIGESSKQRVKLRFDAKTLKDCPSSQLQMIGDLMSDKDTLFCKILSSTILYTVKEKPLQQRKICQTDSARDFEQGESYPYDLQILTVVEEHTHSPCQIVSETGETLFSGAAGQCILTYPSGGKLLTSMTHWIELTQLDVAEENLFKTSEEAYGTDYALEQRVIYDSIESEEEKVSWRSKMSANFIQRSTPAISVARKFKKGW